ncbi:MAG: maleylpyruvate isomerase family mycothiol-dependent enzyme [Sporichthyaceae bacterium]
MADRMALAAQERADLADLLDTLSPQQWRHPTLCEGWTVRDVVAHVISYEGIGPLGVAAAFVRGGLSPTRINRVRLAAYRDHEPAQLVAILRAHLRPRGLTAGFGGGVGLTDCLIHHQDILRPLRLARDVPSERLREALSVALKAPTLPARRNAKGLRLVATDLDWRHGAGAEVRGPGEALLLALAGRAEGLTDLAGPGLTRLEGRLASVRSSE